MKIAIIRESFPGERRVALVPANVGHLTKVGAEVLVQSGAGSAAGFPDARYEEKGARVLDDPTELFSADIVLQVRSLGADPETGRDVLSRLRPDQIVIGTFDPLGNPRAAVDVAATGARQFALELIPRITRAQSMDVLSSMATIAGYRAVLMAAMELPRMFPMMTTAAGTLIAARVFVIGAGVAGLQACATAKRLGGVVRAYDVRPACREQVESVGAKFVQLALDAGQSEDQGGYAKAMDEEFYRRQRELMAEVVADSDVVITTAAIPGRPSPLLITREAVEGMSPGSVIVDLAAERGGNCQVSQADARVVHHDVTVLGPTNLPAEVPNHASQMYSNNVTKFLLNLIKDGQVEMNMRDEIIADTLITSGGEVVNSRLRSMLELPPLDSPPLDPTAGDEQRPAGESSAATVAGGPASEVEQGGGVEDRDSGEEKTAGDDDATASESDKQQGDGS